MVLATSLDILPRMKWVHPIISCWVGGVWEFDWWCSRYAVLSPLIRVDVRVIGVCSWVSNFWKLCILTSFLSSDSLQVRKWSWSKNSLQIDESKGRWSGCWLSSNLITAIGDCIWSLYFGLHTVILKWRRMWYLIQLNRLCGCFIGIWPLKIHEPRFRHWWNVLCFDSGWEGRCHQDIMQMVCWYGS